MKRFLFFFLTFLQIVTHSVSADAQDKNTGLVPDPRLYQIYTTDYVDNKLSQLPAVMLYMNYRLDHSYEIIDHHKGKPEDESMPDLKKIAEANGKKNISGMAFLDDFSKFNPKEFNILALNLKTDPNKRTVYNIGHTGKALMVYSEREIVDGFNKYREELSKTKK